jgi:hypothetical protein
MLFSTVALALVSMAIAPRFHGVPGVTAIAAYLLLVVPAGLCALPVAALMDRYFGEQNAMKAFVTIAFWSTVMVGSLLAWPDIVGFGFLRHNAPSGTTTDFSVGIVSAQNMARVPWKALDLPAWFAGSRFGLLAAVIAASGLVCLIARMGLMHAITRAGATSAASAAPAIPAVYLPRLRPTGVGSLPAGWMVARRWFRGTKLIGALFVTSLVIALAAPSTRAAIGAAFLLPLAIVNSRRISGAREVRLFERGTAAFWRPSPLLFTSLILAVVTAVPLIPALGQMHVMRSVHVLIGIGTAALWLTWSCAGIGRPLLGISVYAFAWYLACFSNLPANADLLGLAETTPVSLAGAVILCAILGVLVCRGDVYAGRGFRNA